MAHIGKTLSDETKRKLSEKQKGRKPSKQTIAAAIKANTGRKKSIEERELVSRKNKEYYVSHPHMKKYLSECTKKQMRNMTEEEKRNRALKISISLTGKIRTEEHRKNLSIASKGRIVTDETKKKMSKNWNHSDERIEKFRNARVKYLKKIGKFNGPCLGKYEKQVLDNLEKCFSYEIKRQLPVVGYFVDGYCPALNLVIEVDEKHHFRKEKIKRDKYRENQIKKKLNCQFLRIPIGEK